MKLISFRRHRSPPWVICYAVWLYFRFTPSVRDVEELLAQRGIEAIWGGDPLQGGEVCPSDRSQPAAAPDTAQLAGGTSTRWW